MYKCVKQRVNVRGSLNEAKIFPNNRHRQINAVYVPGKKCGKKFSEAPPCIIKTSMPNCWLVPRGVPTPKNSKWKFLLFFVLTKMQVKNTCGGDMIRKTNRKRKPFFGFLFFFAFLVGNPTRGGGLAAQKPGKNRPQFECYH